MKKLLILLLNVLVLSGFSSPADTIVPLRPPRPPKNWELSPHVRLNRGRQLTLTNLVIFIRFADEEEFSESFETVNMMFNDTTPYNISVHNYYNVMTYGKMNYNSVYTNNIQDTAIVSYQDSHPRYYYQPRSTSNPDGYAGTYTALFRERQLLRSVVQYVDSLHLVDTTVNLDGNGDGMIDNVSFVITGDVDGWDDLLWPHMEFFVPDSQVCINGKLLRAYNFEFANSGPYFSTDIFCHEMAHSLGLPDLYHYYYYTYIHPVFYWDLMGQNNLQQISAILKYKFLGVVDEPVEITEDGHYVLNSVTSSDQNNCYFIRSSLNPSQWYTIEYRNCDDFMDNVPHSGVIIGRWNDNADLDEVSSSGNSLFNNTTVPHTYWVFRPNSSSDITNGNVNDAAFGYDNRTAFGPTTNPHPYLTTGTPETSFEITNIQYSGDYASFDVRFLTDGVRDYGEDHITVYPNPVNTELNILTEDVGRVEIYDLLGKMVLSDDCPDSRIDVSSLMQGMYVVKIFTRNGCYTEKFMKK